MAVPEQMEKSIIELLNSDVSTNQISRKADINLSIVSKLRNDKIDLQNVKWFNIKNLYNYSQEVKKGD